MLIKKHLELIDFYHMQELEKQYYDDKYITPYKECYEWYSKYPYSIMAVEDNGLIIGFLNLFPIKQHIFNDLKIGKYNDKELKHSDIVELSNTNIGELSLFLSCVVIKKNYRKSNALNMLLKHYIEFYDKINCKISINEIITDNVTEQGERFSQRLGFKYLTNSNHNSKIYITSYSSFRDNIKLLEL